MISWSWPQENAWKGRHMFFFFFFWDEMTFGNDKLFLQAHNRVWLIS